jgi:hypothetical protein
MIVARIDRLDPHDRKCAPPGVGARAVVLADLLKAVDPTGPDDPVWDRLSDSIARDHDTNVRFENAQVRTRLRGLSFRLRRGCARRPT